MSYHRINKASTPENKYGEKNNSLPRPSYSSIKESKRDRTKRKHEGSSSLDLSKSSKNTATPTERKRLSQDRRRKVRRKIENSEEDELHWKTIIESELSSLSDGIEYPWEKSCEEIRDLTQRPEEIACIEAEPRFSIIQDKLSRNETTDPQNLIYEESDDDDDDHLVIVGEHRKEYKGLSSDRSFAGYRYNFVHQLVKPKERHVRNIEIVKKFRGQKKAKEEKKRKVRRARAQTRNRVSDGDRDRARSPSMSKTRGVVPSLKSGRRKRPLCYNRKVYSDSESSLSSIESPMSKFKRTEQLWMTERIWRLFRRPQIDYSHVPIDSSSDDDTLMEKRRDEKDYVSPVRDLRRECEKQFDELLEVNAKENGQKSREIIELEDNSSISDRHNDRPDSIFISKRKKFIRKSGEKLVEGSKSISLSSNDEIFDIDDNSPINDHNKIASSPNLIFDPLPAHFRRSKRKFAKSMDNDSNKESERKFVKVSKSIPINRKLFDFHENSPINRENTIPRSPDSSGGPFRNVTIRRKRKSNRANYSGQNNQARKSLFSISPLAQNSHNFNDTADSESEINVEKSLQEYDGTSANKFINAHDPINIECAPPVSGPAANENFEILSRVIDRKISNLHDENSIRSSRIVDKSPERIRFENSIYEINRQIDMVESFERKQSFDQISNSSFPDQLDTITEETFTNEVDYKEKTIHNKSDRLFDQNFHSDRKLSDDLSKSRRKSAKPRIESVETSIDGFVERISAFEFKITQSKRKIMPSDETR